MAIGMLVVPTVTALVEALNRFREQEADRDPDRHRQEDPQRQVAVERGEVSGAPSQAP